MATTASWVSDLLNRRYSGTQDPRKKRQPIGFDFTREPFDPSSYYNELGSFRDVSRAATGVVNQEVANRQAAEQEAAFNSLQNQLKDALTGINPNYTYSSAGYAIGKAASGISKKYGLKKVSSNVARAADYFGSRFGIGTVGGWRAHGSVPGSDHPKGLALDFMIKNRSQGSNLASDVIRSYKQWNVKYVIWNRMIWSPQKGWRKYSGPSDHTDHVHVSFYN